MNYLRPIPRSLLIPCILAWMSLASTQTFAQNGPPPGLARLTHLGSGNVSIQPNGLDQWGQASNNTPIDPGDRVAGDPSATGELEAAQSRVYFGNGADVTLVSLDQYGVQVGVAAGSVNVASDGFPPGQSLSIQTPNGAVTMNGPALFRVDVYPDQQSTVITNSTHGNITLNGGGGFNMVLELEQSVQLTGTNPVYAQMLQPAPYDQFAHWSGAIESHRFNSVSARYVSTEMAGYDQLDNNGEWQPQSDYGPIWFPRVDQGWAPYHNGHWVNRPFYGWTWVADEPWGIAPFHYGRWVQVQGRWGWIPGPREVHPVWSPAQVVFAGGIQLGGVGVSVWFPLGPGEPYKPWYPATPEYINQINITNIHESKVVHVQNVYNTTIINNVTYVNRTVGVTAMNQQDFAAGRSAQVAAVKVNPQQIQHIQAAAPAAPPPAQRLIIHPIAKPAAVAAARPVLINNKGQQAAAMPHAKPIPVPVKAAPPAPKPIPGHTAIGAPSLGAKPAAADTKAAAPVKPVPPPAAPAPAKSIPAQPAPAKAEPAKAAPAKPGTPTPAEKPAVKPATPPVKPGTKPNDAKPADTKPTATKPAEPKPLPAKPADTKPTTTKPVETKPTDTKPAANPKDPKEAKKAADAKKKEEEKKSPPPKPE